jgi:hypothetical protein
MTMQAQRHAPQTPVSTRLGAVALIASVAIALNAVPLVAEAAFATFKPAAITMHQSMDWTQADDTTLEAGASVAAYER